MSKLVSLSKSFRTSVIIPCYNEEKYIGKCLQSLSEQSQIPDEVIVCDNNSTDNTVGVASSFRGKLPIYIVHEPTKGIRPTVETAWKNAKGDIILKTDADCILPKDWVKNMTQHFFKDDGLTACGGVFLASDGPVIIRLLAILAIPFYELNFKLLRGHRLLFGGNFAIKRSILKSVNGYEIDDISLPDDQLICHKLKIRSLKYKRFYDCWNYTSTRSFGTIGDTLNYFRSSFNPKYYKEKSI